MSLTPSFSQKFSKKGIFITAFEEYVESKDNNQTFDVDYKIPHRFGKMFTRPELVNIFAEIFSQLQFTKITIGAPIPCINNKNDIVLKDFEYCFYKIESSDDFSTKEVICNDNDNWIGIKAKFSQ